MDQVRFNARAATLVESPEEHATRTPSKISISPIPLFIALSIVGHTALVWSAPMGHAAAAAPEPTQTAWQVIAPLEEKPEPAPLELPEELLPEPEPPEPEPAATIAPREEREELRIPEPAEAPDEVVETPAPEALSPEELTEAPGQEGENADDAASTLEGGTVLTGDSPGDAMTIHSGGGGSGAGDRAGAPAPHRPAPPSLTPSDRRHLVSAYLREVHRALGVPRPTRALLRSPAEGVVHVSMMVDPQGHVGACRVRRSSGNSILDAAALAHVQSRDRVPAPPEALRWQTREITLPVRFEIGEAR